jgi:two-component system response regulator FixJ
MAVLDPEASIIVIVDDDDAVRGALAFALGLEGFFVRAYASAEALMASGPFPRRGCLVLDYRLPDTDGLLLLETLRGRGVTLPAILITTHPSRALRTEAGRVGMSIVEKPLACDALTDQLRLMTAHAGSPAAHHA